MAGGGGGFMQAMINSLRDNKNLISKRKSFAERRKDYLTSYSKLKITPEKATKEQIETVRKIINTQKKIVKRNTIIILLLTSPLLFYTIYFGIDLFQSPNPTISSIKQKENTTKYNFYIEDGDKMINNKKWNNAIFQYNMALEIFPNELDAQYRLALAYSYKCKYKNESCLTADSLVNRLYNYYPNNLEIKELKDIIKHP